MKWTGTARDGDYKADFSPECRIALDETPTSHHQARRFGGFVITFHLDGRFCEQHKRVRFGSGPCIAAEAKRQAQHYLEAHAPAILAAARSHAQAHGHRLSSANGDRLNHETGSLKAELSHIEAGHESRMRIYVSEVEDARRGLRDRTVVTGIVRHPGWRRSQSSVDRDVENMGSGATHVPPSTSYATTMVPDYPDKPHLPPRAHEIRKRLGEIAAERRRYGHARDDTDALAESPRGPGPRR